MNDGKGESMKRPEQARYGVSVSNAVSTFAAYASIKSARGRNKTGRDFRKLEIPASLLMYEYMETPVQRSMEALYADRYQSLGWQMEGSGSLKEKPNPVNLKLNQKVKQTKTGADILPELACSAVTSALNKTERIFYIIFYKQNANNQITIPQYDTICQPDSN